jgi:hypothetical protein
LKSRLAEVGAIQAREGLREVDRRMRFDEVSERCSSFCSPVVGCRGCARELSVEKRRDTDLEIHDTYSVRIGHDGLCCSPAGLGQEILNIGESLGHLTVDSS